MSFLFQSSGLLTTLQDLGRSGYARFGINPNGTMDKRAARIVNILLGNDENEAVLEMHFPAPRILFGEDAIIALGGANFSAKIDDKPIENWRVVSVEKDSMLSFTDKKQGARAYLAVRGGFDVEKWLGSASTNLIAKVGGFEGRAFTKGDGLLLKAKGKSQKAKVEGRISASLIPAYNSSPKVRVITGAEWENLTTESQERFSCEKFMIRRESDRMGFRLRGSALNLSEDLELISSAVGFGTIQLLPDGQLIILMADHQTTGGYPRIAHIISEDLSLVGQLEAESSINFELITIEEAENLTLQFEKELNWLKVERSLSTTDIYR